MATREKKTRLNTDSPTPPSAAAKIVGGGENVVPTTTTATVVTTTEPPSTPTAATRGRRSRIGTTETATPTTTEKETAEVVEKETEKEEKTKGEENEEKASEATSPEKGTITVTTPTTNTSSTIKTRKLIRDNMGKKKLNTPAAERKIGTRSLEGVKKMKRRSLPDAKARLNQSIGRRNSTGRITQIMKKKIKETLDLKTGENPPTTIIPARRGRPRKIEGTPGSPMKKSPVKPGRKRLRANSKESEEKVEKSIKLEGVETATPIVVAPVEITIITDTATKSLEIPETKELVVEEEPPPQPPPVVVKKIENNNDDQKEKVKVETGEDNLDKKPIRRSGRSRKSILKEDKEKKSESDIKTESSIIDESSSDSVATTTSKEEIKPLHIESGTTPETAKASSLSPQLLESEGVSEISVKRFYGEPAFRENNLGIEKDPMLGEIVQVHEKSEPEEIPSKTEEIVVKKDEEEEKKVVEIKPEEEEKKVEQKSEEEEPVKKPAEETSVEVQAVEVKIETKPEEATPEIKTAKEEEFNETIITENGKEDKVDVDKEKEEEHVPVDKIKSIADQIQSLTELTLERVSTPPKPIEETQKVDPVEVVHDPTPEKPKSPEPVVEKSKPEPEEVEAPPEPPAVNIRIIEAKIEQPLPPPPTPSPPVPTTDVVMIDRQSSPETVETAEAIKQKESHLKSLGLITIQAADEAKIEKQRQKDRMQNTKSNASASSSSSSTSTSSRGNKSRSNAGRDEYTGTLKTVIKLNRPDQNKKERKRLPLKMTFQKGRGKNGHDRDGASSSVPGNDEDTYYTIQNDADHNDANSGQSRKTHYRSYTDGTAANVPEPTEEGDEKKDLVIPEKASSFKFHPGRLCQDQCFYCGGKFGLFDTPCHVAQIKSPERQKKILDNEEKLTVDSCLCDACYRHVDRRANCPSYKKRLSAPPSIPTSTITSAQQMQQVMMGIGNNPNNKPSVKCSVTDCDQSSVHSLRRKWFIKMKKSITKLIHVNIDPGNSTQGLIPICDSHYDLISHLMICNLCKRKLTRNHIFYITQELLTLQNLLSSRNIPVYLGSMAVVCKLCKYFANLLLKPPENSTQKAEFVRTYYSRLLQFYNVEMVATNDSDADRSRDLRHMNDTQSTNDPSFEGGHIMLDNDVMVDYDLPMIDISSIKPAPPKTPRPQQSLLLPKKRMAEPESDINSDMARALRANPNISMRELFPGEEEMNLYAHIPFNCGKKTPEGWSKTTTVLQYDDVTRQMWEDLQKPYGNQSSFLRHLVLLEKYFRNGDLMLSQNASYNASIYAESVQNRLRSFDNIPTGGHPIMQKLGGNPVSIMPAVTITPKSRPVEVASRMTNAVKPSPQLVTATKNSRQISITSDSNAQDILAAASKLINSENETPPKRREFGPPPPELISIPKSSANQSVSVTPVANSKQPTPSTSTPIEKSPNSKSIIKLPDVLTPSERKQTIGKQWRPTLLPFSPEANNGEGPFYQTADGRRLPGLVQVMSGGKPYHISIHDYNRMCILRREKLIQLQMASKKSQSQPSPQQNDKNGPPSTSPSTSSSIVHTYAKPKEKFQIPNKILEQNSLIPMGNSGNSNANNKSNVDALRAVRKSNNQLMASSSSSSLLKSNVQTTGKSGSNSSSSTNVFSTFSSFTPPHLPPSIEMIPQQFSWTPTQIISGTSSSSSSSSTTNDQNLNGTASVVGEIKIPKSLTIIPQQKSRSRVTSVDGQHNASA